MIICFVPESFHFWHDLGTSLKRIPRVLISFCFSTCPVNPARVVVKFTSEMIADPSGGSSGLGFLVVINSLKIQTGVTSSETTHTRISKTNAKSQTGQRIPSFQIVPDRYIHRNVKFCSVLIRLLRVYVQLLFNFHKYNLS